MVDWASAGSMSAEEMVPQLSELLKALDRRLEEQPELRDRLLAVIAQTCDEPVDRDTFTGLSQSLNVLFGLEDEPSVLFAWLAQADPEGKNRVDLVARTAPKRVAETMRDVFALHGECLRRAFRRWQESPEAWDVLNRDVYYDISAERFHIDLRIVKYSGETVNLRCDPNSLLSLTQGLVTTLNQLASTNPFDQQYVDALREAMDTFSERLAAAEQATSGAAKPDAISESASTP